MFVDKYIENLKVILETNSESIYNIPISLIGEIIKNL